MQAQSENAFRDGIVLWRYDEVHSFTGEKSIMAKDTRIFWSIPEQKISVTTGYLK